MLYQPARLRDERENLKENERKRVRKRKRKIINFENVPSLPMEFMIVYPVVLYLSLKVYSLVEMNEFLHPLHGLHTGVTFLNNLYQQSKKGFLYLK